MIRSSWLSVLGTLALVACGGGGGSLPPPQPPSNDTALGPGDVFDIRVYGEEELTGSYRVARDGSIDYPFIGRVEVGGLEAPEVSSLIASRLREGQYLRDPQVSVFVQEYNSKRVSVVGAVKNPGTLPITSGLTVVEAISRAGGFTSIASRNDVVVARRVDGELRRFQIPVEDITEGQLDDFPLQAGDIVYVSERLF